MRKIKKARKSLNPRYFYREHVGFSDRDYKRKDFYANSSRKITKSEEYS